jgi:hypothetical protein
MSSRTQRGIAAIALIVMIALIVVGAVLHVPVLSIVGVVGAIPIFARQSGLGKFAGRSPLRALTARLWASPGTGFAQHRAQGRRAPTISRMRPRLLRSSKRGAGSEYRCAATESRCTTRWCAPLSEAVNHHRTEPTCATLDLTAYRSQRPSR